MIKWKLKSYLDTHGLSAYKLIQESGLASNTIYEMARGESESASLKTLESVIKALREVTGEEVRLEDVVEIVDEETAPEGESEPNYLALVGLIDDPDSPGDISQNVDKYLGEVLEEEYRKGIRGER